MKRVVCASARAFVASPLRAGGGNPVSVFLPSGRTTTDERIRLAQSADWESIVIENASSDDGSPPKFHFFMPSGEEVSFCGHAAIGACSFLANKNSIISRGKTCSNFTFSPVATLNVTFLTAEEGLTYDAKVTGNQVELSMDTQHYEMEPQPCSLLEDILGEIGLDMGDVPAKYENGDIDWPVTLINSSVARPKTLIPIKTVERLHAATAPRDPAKFKSLCDSIDSTGIYLFTKQQIEEARSNNRLRRGSSNGNCCGCIGG